MEWICGVTYMPKGFCLRTVDGNQAEHVRPVKELQAVLADDGDKLTRLRGNTSFADWRELSNEETDALAIELGFPTGCNGQTFYEFKVEDQRYIIPAGVLMCAMFRPFHGIAKYLFAPQGLDNLCIPYGNCEKPELLFFIVLRNSTGIQADKAEGILNSLSWMHCFPSARKMWCSAFLNALDGRLSLTLPNAGLNFSCHAQQLKSNTLLIQAFRIYNCVATEEPIESYSRHTKSIYFERTRNSEASNASRRNRRYPIDSRIPLRNGECKLSDDEWSAIKEHVVINHKRAHLQHIRRFIDCHLQKLSQGITWSKLIDDDNEQALCRKLAARMKADGRWDVLITHLTQLRETA